MRTKKVGTKRGGEAFPELGEHTEKLLEEHALARDLSPRQRKRQGIGRRFSLKRWAMGRAAKSATGKRGH